jgi:hypothetical protein
MTALPQSVVELQTVTAMRTWWEQKLGRVSRRLGASQIGRECEAQLWYGFRWASKGEGFDGRMLRLFDRGHREEAVFIAELRGIGAQVHDLNPQTGEQYEFTACGGHFVAKIDGAALNLPGAPKTWHVVGFKTANNKSFSDTKKKGVKDAKPEHYAQNQVEMRLADLTRTLYLMVNKDTDEVYGERIREDKAAQDALMAKAERVIFSAEPGPGISKDPAFFKCKMCPAAAVCHGQQLAEVSCRTCLHATPEKDGDGRWSCAKRGIASLNLADQQAACCDHLFIPALVTYGALEDASEAEGWVQYKTPDGFVFRNGPRAVGSYSSKELNALSLAALRSPELQAIRNAHLPDAEWVPREEFKAVA